MALGLAVLIRPTNAMLALPIALALGRPDRRWLWVAAGGVPAAVFMALLNRAAYGNLFATGYGDVSEFFGLKWVGVSTAHYARWLPVVLTPLFLVALAAPWHRSVPRRLLWSHAAWVAASATFYSFYYFTHREWWYLRFLLPSLPSLLVLAGLGAEALVAHLRSPLVRRALWGAAAISIAVNANLRWHSLGLRGIGQTGARFTEMHQFIAESVPANAVVLSLEGSGTLFFSTNLCIVRWDTLDDAWPRVRDGALRAGRPLYATLFTFEDEQRFRERTPGNWEFVAQHGLATLWRLKPSP
ncbi:hypothetical protein [Oleiharenicola sp. Vm1]|uniref:hypothetical protein n=1 Tax=Oleiharenicola sp. Vm1 TaxID=3398393 RepID=UPI0039F4E222